MTEPNYSVGFSALTLGTSGSIAVGDALVFNAASGYWLRATAANRTAADSRAQAIALTAYGGSAIGTVSYQAAGILAASISGLAATTPGLYQLVRVSTAGRLERVASFTTGDDIVGYAYPDGRVALHIGIPWSLIAGTFAGAALPDNSVQYRKTDGTLGGSNNVGMGTSSARGSFATLGDIRLTRDWAIYGRNTAGTQDLCAARVDSNYLYAFWDPAAATTRTYEAVDARARLGLTFSVDTTGTPVAGFGASSGEHAGIPTARLAFAYPNFYLASPTTLGALSTDPARGGQGYICLRLLPVAGSGNPPTGWTQVYPDATTGHLMQRLSDGTLFDLTDGGSQTTVNVTSATPGDVAITSSTRVVNFNNASGSSPTGFTAPTNPAAGLIVITNGAATGNVEITANSGATAANGVSLYSGTLLVVPPKSAVTLAYDYNAARWIVALGASTSSP